MKKRYFLVILLAITSVFLTTCQREDFLPVNIYEGETLGEDAVSLKAEEDTSVSGTIYINSDNLVETDFGYKMTGSLFSKTEKNAKKYGKDNTDGAFPFASGKFDIYTNPNDPQEIDYITGEATPHLPDDGIFLYFEPIVNMLGVFRYDKGSEFLKDDRYKSLPLEESTYYYAFGAPPTGGVPTYNLSKTSFQFSDIFIDARDPMVLARGDLQIPGKKDLFEIGGLTIGLSANKNLIYRPLEFSQRMQDITGGLELKQFNGDFYMAGEVPLDKFTQYPVKLEGEVVINSGDFTSGNSFFDKGFEGNFSLGANGRLLIDHALLDLLPPGNDIELGRASVEIINQPDEKKLTIAGEMSPKENLKLLQAILPESVANLFDFYQASSSLYLNINDNGDFKLFVSATTSFDIPGLGHKDLSDVFFCITPDSILFYGKMTFSVLGDNYYDFYGFFDKYGNFKLSGSMNQGITIKDITIGSKLGMEISSDIKGVRLWGTVDIPFGIVDLDVEGLITLDELTLKGTLNSQLDFGNDVKMPAINMEVEISTKTGVYLSGILDVPYGIAYVEVTGKVTSEEMSLLGKFSSHIDFGNGVKMPGIDIILSASTKTGVYVRGLLDVPYGIALVDIEGRFNTSELTLTASFKSEIQVGDFKLPSIEMYLKASTDINIGIQVYGKIEIPAGIGKAEVDGKINAEGISFRGSIISKFNLGITAFAAEVSLEIDKNHFSFKGELRIPFGLGYVYFSGNLYSDMTFKLTGKVSVGFDFDIIYLEAGVEITITNNYVKFYAYGKGSVLGIEYTVGIDAYVNWSKPSLKLCIDFALGDACITLDKDGKDIETGKQRVFRLDDPNYDPALH